MVGLQFDFVFEVASLTGASETFLVEMGGPLGTSCDTDVYMRLAPILTRK